MSYQAVTWAMYDAPMLLTEAGKPDSTARQVLGVLAEHADEHGVNAYPGPVRIAYATGLDERTIERAERRLERAGLIARDGIARNGCIRWRLNLLAKRPASDFEEMQASAEKAKRAESDRRQERRKRKSVDVSGTQNAGQSNLPEADCIDGPGCVRHAESGCPARRMPDVRHAAPPEPPVEPPYEPPSGGTLPPDPLRPQGPPSSDLGNETQNSFYEGDHQPLVVGTTTYVAREAANADPTMPLVDEDEISADQPEAAVVTMPVPQRQHDESCCGPECRSPPLSHPDAATFPSTLEMTA